MPKYRPNLNIALQPLPWVAVFFVEAQGRFFCFGSIPLGEWSKDSNPHNFPDP